MLAELIVSIAHFPACYQTEVYQVLVVEIVNHLLMYPFMTKIEVIYPQTNQEYFTANGKVFFCELVYQVCTDYGVLISHPKAQHITAPPENTNSRYGIVQRFQPFGTLLGQGRRAPLRVICPQVIFRGNNTAAPHSNSATKSKLYTQNNWSKF